MIHVINIEDYQYSDRCWKIMLGTFAPETFYVFEHSENDALDALADWLKEKDTMHGLWSQTDENTDWEDMDLAVYGNESDVMLDNVFIRKAYPYVFLKVSIGPEPEVYEEIAKRF